MAITNEIFLENESKYYLDKLEAGAAILHVNRSWGKFRASFMTSHEVVL